LNEQLGHLLVNLAHQLNFYLDSTALHRLSKNSQIHYLLVVKSCKHKENFNFYWRDKLKLNCLLFVVGFLLFFNGFYQKKPGGFITWVSEPWWSG